MKNFKILEKNDFKNFVKKNNLICKSILNKSQLKQRRDDGFNKIEIQLFDKILTYKEKQKWVDYIVDELDFDVVSVHSALNINEYFDSVVLSAIMLNDLYNTYYKDACEFADIFSKNQNHLVNVVIHDDLDLNMFEMLSDKIGVNSLLYPAKKYNNINILIENIPPIIIYKNTKLTFTNGSHIKDICDIAIFLNKKINKNKFGVVFDTCHFKMFQGVENFVKTSSLNFNYSNFEFYDVLQNLTKEEQEMIKEYHLNNCLAGGFDQETHSSPFLLKTKDMEFLEKFYESKEKYTLNANIVLEILEKDYIKAPNISKTVNTIYNVITK